MKTKKLIIFGTSGLAEVVHQYFHYDSDYEVVAFTVERSYLQSDNFLGLPVVAFEEVQNIYKPEEHEVFVAVNYSKLNRLRTKFCKLSKQKGYKLASYISPRAFVWHNVKIGEHCFIFEDNTVQTFVEIGDNVILWSGNHIGHHSKIGNNCFISSHVVICGFCNIGDNCFFGVNSVVANNVTVAEDCFINSGANVMKDTKPREIYNPPASEVAKIDSFRLFKADAQEVF